MNPKAIVLTIIPTIMLIKDQKWEYKQESVGALPIIAATVEANTM